MNEMPSEVRLPTLATAGSDHTTLPPNPSFDLPTLNGFEAPQDLASLSAPPLGPPPEIPGYEIFGVLGRGGMGVVYKARQSKLDRFVALKVLKGGSRSAEDLARFEREATAAARLSHSGIVQIYEAGVYADNTGERHPYIAFEFVLGTSLDRVLRDNRLTPRQAAFLLLALTRAVAAIHEVGVVHRDLKPANVLLQEVKGPGTGGSPDSQRATSQPPGPCLLTPKIADFGLAHLLEGDQNLTRIGQVVGTPSYMAPEQIAQEGTQRGNIGPGVDIHALGAILYECLTGMPPFKGTCIAETLVMVGTHDPTAVRKLRPDCPRDLETICLKCLRKSPAQRYASASDLALDLELFLLGKPINARPISRFTRALRWCWKRPLTTALATALSVTLIATAALMIWYSISLAAQQGAIAAAEEKAQNNRLLAIGNEYHALTQTISRLPASLEPGWPSRSLTLIQKASALQTPLRDPLELRSRAAEALAAVHIDSVEPLQVKFSASCLAFHPSEAVLAVAQEEKWPLVDCQVVLMEIPSGRVMRHLGFSPGIRWNAKLRSLAQDGVCALTFSRDGRWLVAATRTNYLVRWDLSQARPTPASWPANQNHIRHLCFSEDALYSVSDDRRLKRWKTSDWKESHQFTASGQPVLHAGKLLVADHDKIHTLNPTDLTPLAPVVQQSASLIAVPAGSSDLAAVARGPSVWLYDSGNRRKLTNLRRKGREAHDSAIDDLIMSPDGSLVVSVSGKTRQIRVWDTALTCRVAELSLLDGPCRVAFDSTGRWLAVLDQRAVRLLAIRPRSVQTLAALNPHPIFAAKWLNQKELAVLAGDRWQQDGQLSIWPLSGRSPRVKRSVKLPESRLPVCLAVDSVKNRLACTSDRCLALVDWANLRECGQVPTQEANDLAFVGSDLWLTDQFRALLWGGGDARTPQLCWDNRFANVLAGLGDLWCIAAGQGRVVVGARDGAVHVLDARTAKRLSTHHLASGPACSVAMDPKERQAFIGTQDGSVHLLTLRDGRVSLLPRCHAAQVWAVNLLPNGDAVTGSADGTVAVWRQANGECRPRLTLKHASPVRGLSATTERGRTNLLVVLAGERAVRIWDLEMLDRRLQEMGLGSTE